jgi:hypothetical protein
MVKGLRQLAADSLVDSLMTLPCDGSRWYARRDGTVRGPFTDEYMARYILLGRIRLNDELSQDGVNWQLAREYPLPIPRELLEPSSSSDRLRLRETRSAVDERVGQRRATKRADSRLVRTERRIAAERRRRGDAENILNDSRMIDFRHHPRGVTSRTSQPLRTVLLVMLLMTLVLAYLGISGR